MDQLNNDNQGDLIQNIKEILHCPFCGSDYHESNIKLMGKVSRNYVMHLICGTCGNNIMASLAYQGRGKQPKFTEDIFRQAQKGPISDDEVMDFFQTMKGFDGNFKNNIKSTNAKT